MDHQSPPNLDSSFFFHAVNCLLADAIHRCRGSQEVSRITIMTEKSTDCTSLKLSISDTGPAIPHGEFSKYFPYFQASNFTSVDHQSVKWGGVLLFRTTDMEERDLRHYQINHASCNVPEIMQLRSVSKNSACFSGTEVLLHIEGSQQIIQQHLISLCQKVEILKIKNIAIEVSSKNCLSNSEDTLLFNGGVSIPKQKHCIDRLMKGFTEYICQIEHGYDESSESSLIRGSLNIGKGMAKAIETESDSQWISEACTAVVENKTKDKTPSQTSVQTKVLFFQDFIYTSVTNSAVDALRKVEWQKFGLTIRNIEVDECGSATIHWDNPLRFQRIDIALHRYKNNLNRAKLWQKEQKVIKNAVEASLNELKENHPQLFLSCRSFQVQQNVPDLARCIAGLVTSSKDEGFRGQCVGIMGLPQGCNNSTNIEMHIKEKLIQIIQNSDMASKQKMQSGSNIMDMLHMDIEEEEEDMLLLDENLEDVCSIDQY